MMCYLSGTAVCSKSKCMRASISRVSSKLACSSLAIARRGGTVGGLKFSDLLGHWLRKAFQFDRFSFNLVGSSAPWLMTAQTRPGTNSTSSSAIDNSSEELLDSWSVFWVKTVKRFKGPIYSHQNRVNINDFSTSPNRGPLSTTVKYASWCSASAVKVPQCPDNNKKG